MPPKCLFHCWAHSAMIVAQLHCNAFWTVSLGEGLYYIVSVLYHTALKNNYIVIHSGYYVSPGEVGKPAILHLGTLTHTMLSLLYVVIFVIILIVDIDIMITNHDGLHYNQTFYLGAFDYFKPISVGRG